jgi:hypothetical protein
VLDRLQLVLKCGCVVLAALLLYQVTRLVGVQNPLADVELPDLSVLDVPTNSPRAPSETSPTQESTGMPAAPLGMPPVMMPGTMPPGFARGNPGMPGGGPPLSPEVQARVNEIHQKEIFGPVPRPVPLTLMGIGGAYVFLQTPSGQSGLVAKGEELGGVKVLRIGTNRVLVEVDGKPQELTIFSGFGSETLLPNDKEPRP